MCSLFVVGMTTSRTGLRDGLVKTLCAKVGRRIGGELLSELMTLELDLEREREREIRSGNAFTSLSHLTSRSEEKLKISRSVRHGRIEPVPCSRRRSDAWSAASEQDTFFISRSEIRNQIM